MNDSMEDENEDDDKKLEEDDWGEGNDYDKNCRKTTPTRTAMMKTRKVLLMSDFFVKNCKV